MATKIQRKVPVKEWIWYLFASILAAWGVAEIILGLILEFANVRMSDFPLYQAQEAYISLFGLSFLHWGLILMGIGVVLAVIVLCICAVRYDRESEKASRRAARLNNFNNEDKVIDASVKE